MIKSKWFLFQGTKFYMINVYVHINIRVTRKEIKNKKTNYALMSKYKFEFNNNWVDRCQCPNI